RPGEVSPPLPRGGGGDPPAGSLIAAPAAAVTSLGPGPGLVDRQAAALDLGAVEGGDGRLGLLVAAHLAEAEPLGPAGVAVHDHLRRLDGAVRPEQLLQRAVGDAVGQVADVQLLAHGASGKRGWGAAAPPGGGRARRETCDTWDRGKVGWKCGT